MFCVFWIIMKVPFETITITRESRIDNRKEKRREEKSRRVLHFYIFRIKE